MASSGCSSLIASCRGRGPGAYAAGRSGTPGGPLFGDQTPGVQTVDRPGHQRRRRARTYIGVRCHVSRTGVAAEAPAGIPRRSALPSGPGLSRQTPAVAGPGWMEPFQCASQPPSPTGEHRHQARVCAPVSTAPHQCQSGSVTGAPRSGIRFPVQGGLRCHPPAHGSSTSPTARTGNWLTRQRRCPLPCEKRDHWPPRTILSSTLPSRGTSPFSLQALAFPFPLFRAKVTQLCERWQKLAARSGPQPVWRFGIGGRVCRRRLRICLVSGFSFNKLISRGF